MHTKYYHGKTNPKTTYCTSRCINSEINNIVERLFETFFHQEVGEMIVHETPPRE
jgi:hypothetical protein